MLIHEKFLKNKQVEIHADIFDSEIIEQSSPPKNLIEMIVQKLDYKIDSLLENLSGIEWKYDSVKSKHNIKFTANII